MIGLQTNAKKKTEIGNDFIQVEQLEVTYVWNASVELYMYL
jgi:hypothetical protein